eukprot:s664_g23.t2
MDTPPPEREQASVPQLNRTHRNGPMFPDAMPVKPLRGPGPPPDSAGIQEHATDALQVSPTSPGLPKHENCANLESEEPHRPADVLRPMTEIRQGVKPNQSFDNRGDDPNQPLELTESASGSKRKEPGSQDSIQLEVQAIVNIAEATNQPLHIAPSTTGGVMGFEANKRTRISPAHQTPMTQTIKPAEEKSKHIHFPETPNATFANSLDEVDTPGDESSKPPPFSTELNPSKQEGAQHDSSAIEQSDINEAIQESAQATFRQGVETMVIFVKHEECKHPIPYTVAVDMTVRKLTHAEAKLGAFAIPVVPKSLVGTHVPLDAEMHANQYVILHQQMPPSLRCPFVSSKFSGQPQSLNLGLPCTRFEALWRQQAWVATDEMDYYLEAVQMEDKALPFPTSVFLNESEAVEWAHEWLAAFASDCGFQALAWMIAIVNDLKVEPLPPCKASQWRHLFVRELCRNNRGHDWVHRLAVGGSAPVPTDIRQALPHQASDMPTAAVPRQFAQIEVRTAGQTFKMFGEVGIGILDVLKCLTDESIPTIRAVTVQDEHSGQTPLQESRRLTPQGIILFVDSPCQMLLSEQDVIASNWPFVVVLHSLGILILKRQAGFLCFDVETAVESFDFEWEAPLLDYTGNRMIEDSIAPNIVFLGTTAKILDLWELLRHPIAFRELAQGFATRIPQNQVHAFIHWIEKIGVHALVRSCGWQFLTQLNQDPATVPIEVYLLPCSDRLPVAPRALCQLVIERIFINQIKFYVTNPMLGENIRVSLKLWRTWAYSFQELEDLEQADVNRLISVLIQNLVEVPADEQHMDLEVIRSSTLRQDGPSFTMVGAVSTVVRFMRDLSATGIEALLRAMGWVTAMSISDSRPPAQVQLHLMPKAGVRHLTLTTVRSFLAHALTIRAMPIPGGIDGDIMVKVKLADSWVLVGRFPPEVRMSIFIDPWYQATSFFGQPARLRMICNSAQVNPDRCLEEYTRTNELGERFAKLFLVLQLHGGGPKETDGERSEDSSSEKPMQTILLTVPRDKDQRLVRMHPEACIQEAFAQIRPGESTADWNPRDSFGFPYDWDMHIHDITCIHFIRRSDTTDESNGLMFLLHHQAKTGVQEIEFFLRIHANESVYRPIAPICITAAKGSHVRNQQLRQWLEGLLEHAMASGRPVASLCMVDQHWIPFVAHVSFDILQVQTTMAGMDLLPQIERCMFMFKYMGGTEEHVQITPSHEALGMYDAWIGARLCAKSYNQLRNMPAPNPTNNEQLEAIRECLMNKDHRVQLLRHQSNLWADDELLYHLQAITAMAGSEPTQVLDPLLARAWAQQEPVKLPDMRLHSTRVVTALHFQHHWTPVILDKQGTFLNVHTLAQPNPKSQVLERFVHTVQMSMGCTAFRWILYHTRDTPNDACGILTIALVGHVLLRLPLPHGIDQVARLGNMLRKRFAKNLPEFCILPYLWATGLSGAKHDPELLPQLAALLKDHGVWAPLTELPTCLNRFRFQPSDLNQFGRKPNKTPARRIEPPKEQFTVSASALEVPPGVFKQQDGTLLGPLRADQIGPNAEGVVLVDQEDSHAALKLPRPVTQKGLAVLVLANKDNSTLHEGEPIRFPAMCTSTQEPLIAAGYMYQMGTQTVQRNEPQVKLAVDERNTEAIRCIVFQDQAGALWDDILAHPVRTILAQEALLRPKGPEDSLVIDVWDRQWVTKRYEKTKAKGADMFLFSFRMLAEHAPELISKSGSNGIYYEPRSSCGRMPNNSFHVTWLPSATYQEAKYAQQTSPQATSLVRHADNADRYGLRSDAMNAQEIHMKHRPDTPLLLGQHKMLYVLGPLPYSTTKQAVTKILKAWNWDARPLQPRGRSQDGSGIQWTIQATSNPSHWIYVLQHGDVLISKVQEERQLEPPAAYSIVASKRTMQHLNQSDQPDPWLMNDPWKQPAKKANGNLPPATMNLPPSVLASIETNVEKRLLATLTPKVSNGDQDMHMEGESMECRVSHLEQQLMQVQAGQAGIEQKIGHVDASIHQIQSSQAGVENRVGQMQQQIDQQSTNLSHTLDRKMNEHMERIEALLSKRGRFE